MGCTLFRVFVARGLLYFFCPNYGVQFTTGYVVAKVNEKIEEQAKKEKQKLQEERKEMIQKLSRIKGRA